MPETQEVMRVENPRQEAGGSVWWSRVRQLEARMPCEVMFLGRSSQRPQVTTVTWLVEQSEAVYPAKGTSFSLAPQPGEASGNTVQALAGEHAICFVFFFFFQ